MVCQLDISTTTTTTTTTNATDSDINIKINTSTPINNKNRLLLNRSSNQQQQQQLLSSLSLTTLITADNIDESRKNGNYNDNLINNRRTSSAILHKTKNEYNYQDEQFENSSNSSSNNDSTFIKNSISLDNLNNSKQQQQQEQQQQINDELFDKQQTYNNHQISMEYLNDNTLVHGLPELDSLVLNKCYLFNRKDYRSNLSLSNKNDIDDVDCNVDDNNDHEDDEVLDDDDDDFFDDDLLTKPNLISSSSESSTSPIINDLQQQQQHHHHHQKQLSSSPSISISISNETKSINSCLSSSNNEHGASSPPIITNNKNILPLNPNYLAAEIISLTSVTSNYSQFDFLNEQTSTVQQSHQQNDVNKKSNSFSAFFNRFTSSNKNKGLNIKNPTTTSNDGLKNPSGGIFSGAFKLFQSNNTNCINENKVVKSNSDYDVPSTVLILENRPSNLPAKSNEEALKHKQEYEKMIEIAKKKEQKEKEIKLKKFEQQIKKEDFMANSLKLWNTEILPKWNECKNEKRTQQLWWHGLPPSIRGKVWKLAIGNELNLNEQQFNMYVKKAQEKIEILSRISSDHYLNESTNHETSVELIKLDVSRTFPQLCFFQRDGPYHDVLHNVLGAYACYNPKIGYVQGMSFLAAILLLNMESSDAFICLSNLLNNNYLIACFCMDQYKMNCYFKIHEILFENNLPHLFRHFNSQKVKPDLYLIEWIFTLFSKSLPLDVVSRVWDVYLRDKEEFLFRAALGILNLYKDILINMDFENIVKFLTKLPEDINSTYLFKSIECMKTSINDENLKFNDLVSAIVG